MINKAIIIGRLGQDPEVRALPSGSGVMNLTLATSESWKDKQTGEKKEKTEWHRVVTFQDGLVKSLQAYLRKGALVYVEGKIQTRKWTDQTGQDKYTTEIVVDFGGSIRVFDKGKNAPSDAAEDSGWTGATAGNTGGGMPEGITDDDIPF